MQKSRRIYPVFIPLLAIIFLAWCGFSVWCHNDRSADSLSAYCLIDFRGLRSPDGRVEDATLSLLDYRYFATGLEPSIAMEADGEIWQLPAATTESLPPTFALQDFGQERCFQTTSRLLVHIPGDLREKIARAEAVSVQFQYQQGPKLKFPLNAPDLAYWKNQLK